MGSGRGKRLPDRGLPLRLELARQVQLSRQLGVDPGAQGGVVGQGDELLLDQSALAGVDMTVRLGGGEDRRGPCEIPGAVRRNDRASRASDLTAPAGRFK